MQEAIEQVLQAVGLAEKAAPSNPPPAAPAAPAAVAVQSPIPNPQSAIGQAPAGETIKTREQLYKLYYAAIMRYRKDHKENPASLLELVKAGYVKAEDSHLDANGKLLCPETQERLGYLHTWEPGDKTTPVLFPLKLDSKTLYADGEIRAGPAERK